MRERIESKHVTKEIKSQMPVIPVEIVKERGCTFCPYYLGNYEKQPRCMMKTCAWDDENERFHPVLRGLIPFYKEKMEKAEVKFLAMKKIYTTLLGMFADEMKQEELEKDECYGCVYGKCGPCIGMANMICDKEIIALEPSAYMRTAFMARLMEHNEVKERISLLPIDVGKYSFRDKISGVMCMGVLGHLKRDEQEKLLYKLDKNLNINVPILIELLEPKFLVAPVGSRISVATQGRLRYETYITDIKQVGMDQWTWRLTYKVFCGKNIVSTVDSLMSWNYQSVEKILNQLTKMHFRTAKLSETLLLAIKAR